MVSTMSSTAPSTGQLSSKQKRLKKSRKRLIIRAIQYCVVVAIAAAMAFIGHWGNFSRQYLNGSVFRQLFWPMLKTGLVNTLLYTGGSLVLALLIGLVIALMRLSEARLYRMIATMYVELLRGLPMLLVLFLVVYGIPIVFGNIGILSNFFVQAIVGLSVITAAYMAETIRAGIQAVPKGQYEAARALGMSELKTMVFVILPQAVRIIIPPLTTQVISLVKDSSLVYVLGVTTGQYELTKMAQVAASGGVLNVASGPTPLLMAGGFYLLVTLPLSQGVRYVERIEAARGLGK
jgi:polar amino acid transport system permease protein